MYMIKKDERWHENYKQLYSYVVEHHQFPDKKKVENRRLLNWWKYNKKCIKEGKLDDDRVKMLDELSQMRTIHL